MDDRKESSSAGKEEAVRLFRDCIPLFHALGDPARQDILLALAENERLNVNQIAAMSSLSRPAISHHLKILKDAGMVSVERRGTEGLYTLELEMTVERLKRLIAVVEEECFL